MLNQSGFFLPPLRLIIGTSIFYFSLLSYVHQLVAAIVVVEAQDNLFWSKKAPNCVHIIFTQVAFCSTFPLIWAEFQSALQTPSALESDLISFCYIFVKEVFD